MKLLFQEFTAPSLSFSFSLVRAVLYIRINRTILYTKAFHTNINKGGILEGSDYIIFRGRKRHVCVSVPKECV